MKQVINWLGFDNSRELDNVLVYASFEIHCAIERSIFETLILTKKNLTKYEEEQCRSQAGLFALMKEVDPNYRKSFEFTKIYVSEMDLPIEIKIMDTGYLKRKWQKLNEYCHRNLSPNSSFATKNRSFQKKGFRLIREVLNYYHELEGSTDAYAEPASLRADLKSIYNTYIDDKIDKEQVRIRIRLITPILKAQIIKSV